MELPQHRPPLPPSRPNLISIAPELRAEILPYVLPQDSVVLMRDNTTAHPTTALLASPRPHLAVLKTNRLFRAHGLLLFWQSNTLQFATLPALQSFAGMCSEEVRHHIRRISLHLGPYGSGSQSVWGTTWTPASLTVLQRFDSLTNFEIELKNVTLAPDETLYRRVPVGNGGSNIGGDPRHRIEQYRSEIILNDLYGVDSKNDPRHVRHWVERRLTAQEQKSLWSFWLRDTVFKTIPVSVLTKLEHVILIYHFPDRSAGTERHIEILPYVRDLCGGVWDINPFAKPAEVRTPEDEHREDLWMEACAAVHWKADIAAAGDYVDTCEAQWCPWTFERKRDGGGPGSTPRSYEELLEIADEALVVKEKYRQKRQGSLKDSTFAGQTRE